MSLLYSEASGRWKVNFCCSSSLIVWSIYNWVQKVGTHIPAAASVTLPKGWAPGDSHAVLGGSLVRGRSLTSQKSKWKQLWSHFCQSFSSSGAPTTVSAYRKPYRTRKTILLPFPQENKPVFISPGIFAPEPQPSYPNIWFFISLENIKRGIITKRSIGLE